MLFFNNNSIAFFVLNIPIYWYGILFMLSGISVYHITKYYIIKYSSNIINVKNLENIFFFTFLGTVLGGRIFFIFLYEINSLIQNPIDIIFSRFQGMSFHGGIVGIIISIVIYTKIKRPPKLFFIKLLDAISIAGPIAMLIGRIANFLNHEHLGKASSLPWAVVFSSDPNSIARHPSQIYESLLEGLVPFLILIILQKKYNLLQKKTGMLLGISITLQGITRIICEHFRMADGYIYGLQMGVVYSIPVLVVGVVIILLKFCKNCCKNSYNSTKV